MRTQTTRAFLKHHTHATSDLSIFKKAFPNGLVHFPFIPSVLGMLGLKSFKSAEEACNYEEVMDNFDTLRGGNDLYHWFNSYISWSVKSLA